MTPRPTTIASGAMMAEAVQIMARRKISELPVVDAEGRPVGLIDITDVVAWLPVDRPAADSAAPAQPSHREQP